MMRKRTQLLTASFVILLSVLLLGNRIFGVLKTNGDESSAQHYSTDLDGVGEPVDLTSSPEVEISIQDYKYTQSNIKIKKGSRVTWVNKDDVMHNVMRAHQHDDEAHSAPTKDQLKADILAGPLLSKGESYSFVFNEIGVFPYHCSPHPFMKGGVSVIE